ncbi:MAG: FAD-dependent oxidoreductase [Xanthobacteraceae bacterium]
MQGDHSVLIAGAGPVGVVAALALARQGIAVGVCEAESEVNDSPRAATTHAATLEMLAELGLVDEVIRRGLIEPKFRMWDRPTGELIAEFDFNLLARDTPFPYVVQCEQHKLVRMTLARLRDYAHVCVDFRTRVSGIEQRGERVEAILEGPSGTRSVAASYLIGADGGRSTVRKALGINFEGYTHPERFLVLTTPFSFERQYQQCSRNYFSDPDEWCALFKVTGDDGAGLWRLLFPTRPDESEAEAFDEEAVQARLQRFFPREGSYQVVHRSLYSVHQRIAASFGCGRVFLAGDAAHVNNPLGGLGLNFGIHDAVELATLLGRVLRHEAPPDLLDQYDLRRRPLNVEYVQQQTIANKRRLEEKDPLSRAKNHEALRKLAADPIAQRAYLLRASLLDSVRQARRPEQTAATIPHTMEAPQPPR